MEGTNQEPFFRGPAGHKLIRVLTGVGTVAGVMAVAIAWRVAHRPESAAFLPILGWQVLIWLPWVGYYYAVRYLVRRLGTCQDATLVGLVLHVLAALLIASTHLAWYWQVSSHASPFLDVPGTRFGAYPFFFVFWFLIDLLLYWAILATPEPDDDSKEQRASSAMTDRCAVRKGGSQHLVRTADIRWIEAQGYYAALVLLLFADTATAGTVPPLFVAIPDHATAVDGGLSRGVAFGDADGDGDADLLVANTINYPEFLYRNDGDEFVQVMETVPSLAGGFTEGVNWVDVDNDGDLDIFAARTDRPNSLYRNDGDWSFVEQEAGDLSTDHSTSSMACWADVDGDGWLDVFVVNRRGERDALYRNRGGRHFERVTGNVVGRAGGDGRSCVFADLDGDGDPDLYVGNFVDTSTEPPTRQRNYLYFNDGDFGFTEVRIGHAVESQALTYGTSAADADNDGDLDLFVTNIGSGDQNHLYLNDGDGTLHLHEAGLSTPVRTPSKGHTWGDFDLDGDIDVAIANGTEGTEHVQNELYLNDGAAGFVAVANEEFVTTAHISAGIAWADIDNDGDLDLYVANWGDGDQDNALYRNQAQGTWLKLSLVGSASNRMAVGARVTIITRRAGQKSQQVRWLDTTTGYASQNEPILHFGLAGATNIDTLSIDWPSGRRDTFENITANQHLRISEGET